MPRRCRRCARRTRKPRQYSDPFAAGLTRGLTLRHKHDVQQGADTSGQSFEHVYPAFHFSPLVTLAIALAGRLKAMLRTRRRLAAFPLRASLPDKRSPDVRDLSDDDRN